MLRAFFRKMYVHNRKGVPTDKPVLLAVNHPTAFVDPCLLCVFLDSPIYNMTRGDIFRKPFFRKLLESINMFPVFRARDGYASRGRNDEVFEFCRQKLEQHRIVTIYVEGEHHLDRHIRPMQKGIARIAFGAYAATPSPDLQIIPAACNYAFGDRPRDEVSVNVGNPIFVRNYWEEYQIDPNAATSRLLHDIRDALIRLSLHIEDKDDQPLAEQLLHLVRAEQASALLPIVEYNNRRFLLEKSVCERINHLSPAEKSDLKSKTDSYARALKKAGLDDAALMHPEWGTPVKMALFIAGFLPFLAGYLSSWPVIRTASAVTRKVVKKREFKSSVHMGVGHLFGMLYYFLLFAASLFTANPWWIALALALPVLGWFSMFYRENWTRWLQARRAQRHPERDNLLHLRAAISLSEG